ncbi:serine/threonine protein kinase [Actinoplanes sp. NBC_00393]|uniref:serine/threonine-protein kinase n=1 Tax=Actinoplanes sp. NBC_00393 TaxID=2975953 RepID=UPI002E1FF863
MSTLPKIGRYQVVERLGSGAFATVWLAEDDVLESRVAIKVLADNWAHHPDVRARFEQEAQVLRRADSERLVRVHDFGELPDGRPYQVMTYAAGGTLADRLEHGPLPVRVALRIAAEIAQAVTVLHESGVLHRDLKPSNVLFDTVRGHERVLVADLGLAKSIAQASGFTVVAGTPGYMAPEQQLPGGGLDVRADVHAIGAMTYQMLTGRTPGAGAVPPSKLRPGVSREIDRIVLRALDPDRKRRWPTTDALAEALDQAIDPRPSRRRRALRWLGRSVGVAVAVAATAAAGGAINPQGTPQDWVRVFDQSSTVSVAVPADWARQVKGSGWDPAAVGLPSSTQRGLLVGADLESWTAPGNDQPGVFAGLTGPAVGAKLPAHPDCVRAPDRPARLAGLVRPIERWTDCAGSSVSYSETLLNTGGGTLYVQIRQSTPVDRTDEILRTVRLTRA